MRKRCPAFPEPHGTQNLPVSPHLPGKSGEITLRPCFLQAQTAWLRASLFPVGSPPAPKQLLPISLRVRGLALLARGSLPPSTRAQSETGRWCSGGGRGKVSPAGAGKWSPQGPRGGVDSILTKRQRERQRQCWGWEEARSQSREVCHPLERFFPRGQGVTISASQNLLWRRPPHPADQQPCPGNSADPDPRAPPRHPCQHHGGSNSVGLGSAAGRVYVRTCVCFKGVFCHV